MENLSNVVAEVTWPSGSLDRRSRLEEEWRMTRAALLELQRLGKPRVNLLFTGMDIVIQNVLQVLGPDLRQPMTTRRRGERLLLPTVAKAGTMILHHVGDLTRDDQRRLLEWTDRAAGRTQVISTTPAPLLRYVLAGAFIDTLYYRLNTVCVDVIA
jgi:hypothetical protein